MSLPEQIVAEQRRHPRYKVSEVSVVVGDRRLGHIMDMSLGGLSFSYISLGLQDQSPVELGIVFGPDGHYLEKLPSRFVSESILSTGASSNPVVVQRRCMQFVGLSREQEERLARFIKVHANGNGT